LAAALLELDELAPSYWPLGLRCWRARASAGSSSEAQYSRRLEIRGPSKVSSATSRMRLRTCWALREGGPQRIDQLAARLAANGRPIQPATIALALQELHAAGLAAVDAEHQDELTGRSSALPVQRDPLLDAVDLHGAHDFRHTYATWLEDAGIPARVIDELMGHEASGRSGQHRGSAMGAHYRHTTPEMAARVVDAIQQRLTIVLQVAEQAVENHPNRSTLRVF